MLGAFLLVAVGFVFDGFDCNASERLERAWGTSWESELLEFAREQPDRFCLFAEERLEACDNLEVLRAAQGRLTELASDLEGEASGRHLREVLHVIHLALPEDLLVQARRLRSHGSQAMEAFASGDLEASLECHRAGYCDALAMGLPALAWGHRVQTFARLSEMRDPAGLLKECDRALLELRFFELPAAVSETWMRRGQALKACGRWVEALESFQEPMRYARAQSNVRMLLFSAHEAGWTAQALGRPREALAYFQECERWARACSLADPLSRALRSQAQTHDRLGQIDRIEPLFKEAAQVALDAGNLVRACDVQMALASRFVEWGKEESALRLLQSANELLDELAESRDPNDKYVVLRPLEARFLYTWFFCVHRLSNKSVGGDMLQRANAALAGDFHFPEHGRLSMILASNDLRAGDIPRATQRMQRLISEAHRTEDRGFLVLGLVHLGLCETSAGEYVSALERFERSIELRRNERMSQTEVEIDAHFSRARRDGTIGSHAVAAAALEFERSKDPRFAKDALAFLDHGRARTLRDSLLREGAKILPHLAQEQPLDRLDLAQRLRASLEADECVLAFDLAARTGLAVSQNEIQLYRLPERQELEAHVPFALAALLDLPDIHRYQQSAGAISEMLLQPVQGMLEDAKRLIVLSDGVLHELPIELLPLPDARAASSFESCDFVFTRFEVTHVVSLRSFVEGRAQREEQPSEPLNWRFAVLGNGEVQGELELEGPGVEVGVVAAQFPPGLAVTKVGASASESWLKSGAMADFDGLHIAAHTWADKRAGRRSAIRLAADRSEDGQLTVPEILELTLPFELAVISGCEAGAGADYGAEGVLSVAWALMFAGTRTVVVSSSPIEDDLPPMLFKHFYGSLQQSQNPERAMRAARLALRKEAKAATDAESRESALRAMCLPFRVLRGPR